MTDAMTAAGTVTAPAKIPDTFRKPGYNYRLIERTDRTAIFAQHHNATSRVLAYEAMVIQRAKRDRVFPNGVLLREGSEFLPSSERWGSLAWTARTLALARDCLVKNGHSVGVAT